MTRKRSRKPDSSSPLFPLFAHLSMEHGIELLESELSEICAVVRRMEGDIRTKVEEGRQHVFPAGVENTPATRMRAADLLAAFPHGFTGTLAHGKQQDTWMGVYPPHKSRAQAKAGWVRLTKWSGVIGDMSVASRWIPASAWVQLSS
jgi:hypothetical protein